MCCELQKDMHCFCAYGHFVNHSLEHVVHSHSGLRLHIFINENFGAFFKEKKKMESLLSEKLQNHAALLTFPIIIHHPLLFSCPFFTYHKGAKKALTWWLIHIELWCLRSNPVTVVWINCCKKTTNKMKTYVQSKWLYIKVNIIIYESHFPAPHTAYGVFLELHVSYWTLFYLHIPK